MNVRQPRLKSYIPTLWTGLFTLILLAAPSHAQSPSSTAEDKTQAMEVETEKAPVATPGDSLSDAELEALTAKVTELDDALNRSARERDRDAFRVLLADNAIFFADELKRGRLDVLAIWQPLFDGKYDFRYEPTRVETHVAKSGDLAYTVGTARTSYTRPGRTEAEVTEGFYVNIWQPVDGKWLLRLSSSLVVHPTLGSARDPRSGLMTAWPELADQIGADVQIHWRPESTTRAASDDLAYTLGEYEVVYKSSVDGEGSAQSGVGNFIAIWQRDAKGTWQLAAEGFTPPNIYQSGGGS